MAEAFAHIHGKGTVQAFSAGSRPSGQVNPKAIEAMKDLKYDLTAHHSTGLQDLPYDTFEAVVTMGCGDACPSVNTTIREDWNIPDPKHLPPDQFREIRDLIERQVKDLLTRL